MSSRHTPRHARLRMMAPTAPCAPPRASVPSSTFRQFALRVDDDSDVRSTRSGGLTDVDLLITDSGLSPDNAAVIERGGMEVVRA
jgi:hypothetical protein